ncbi:hypothetical protein BH23PLA1_BH23PLA1_42330 [soil metagenome]
MARTAGRPRHPNKHIEEAIQYAEARGWICRKASPRAHAWGRLLCPGGERGACLFSVWSTPNDPQMVAANLVRRVDRCEHDQGTEDAQA